MGAWLSSGRPDYGQRMWTPPGGMLDAGEAPHEAALRRRHPGIRFVFVGHLASGQIPSITDDELDDMGWFAPDALPDRHMVTLPVAIADATAGLTGVTRSIDDPNA